MTLFSFDKGQGLSEHTAPFDAMAEILDGEAEIRIGRKSVKVKADEFIIMPANRPHALHAAKKFKMALKDKGVGFQAKALTAVPSRALERNNRRYFYLKHRGRCRRTPSSRARPGL